jgi:hypothetical protein
MLTLPQIYQRTDKRRKESAKYVKIIHQKRGWDSHGRGYVACASYSTKEWNPWKQRYVKNPRIKNRYVSVFVFLDPRLHVVVSCSCADFKYRWEFSLNQTQAAEIEYSNGEFPKIRNPQLSKRMCKHLLKLYEVIKPELPKAKKGDKSEPIKPPKVQIPPSILKQQEEERRRKEEQQRLKELERIQKMAPKKGPAKPSRKQSTMPRPRQEAPKVQTPSTPKTKRGRSPEMTNWMFNTPSNKPPATPAPKPASKPQVTTRGPAMMTPTRVTKPSRYR